jgi:hypothetical protein
MKNRVLLARCQWLMPVILATQEAEIRSIMVQSQLQTNSSQDPILRKLITNKKKKIRKEKGKKGLAEWLKQ